VREVAIDFKYIFSAGNDTDVFETDDLCSLVRKSRFVECILKKGVRVKEREKIVLEILRWFLLQEQDRRMLETEAPSTHQKIDLDVQVQYVRTNVGGQILPNID
jgi:hypothetical protein